MAKAKPTKEARHAARDYLRWKLGDRRGFRHLLEEIEADHPDIFREIVTELALAFDAFRLRAPAEPPKVEPTNG